MPVVWRIHHGKISYLSNLINRDLANRQRFRLAVESRNVNSMGRGSSCLSGKSRSGQNEEHRNKDKDSIKQGPQCHIWPNISWHLTPGSITTIALIYRLFGSL